MSVAWPAVRAALVAGAPAVLPGVLVLDGPVVTGEAATSYFSVADQPSSPEEESSGSFEQAIDPSSGYFVQETGSVLCELGALTGDTTVPDVFALFAALSSWVQQDQTLGGALDTASTVTVSATVLEVQDQSGARQQLLVSVDYFTRL